MTGPGGSGGQWGQLGPDEGSGAPDGAVPDGAAPDGAGPHDAVPHDAVPYDFEGPDGGAAPPRTVDPRTRPARHGRLRHPWRLTALVVIVVGLVILIGGYLWVRSEADPSGPQGAQVIVTVPAG